MGAHGFQPASLPRAEFFGICRVTGLFKFDGGLKRRLSRAEARATMMCQSAWWGGLQPASFGSKWRHSSGGLKGRPQAMNGQSRGEGKSQVRSQNARAKSN
jgi:hypothetical protein